MVEVFNAAGQLWKVRPWMWISLVVLALTLYWGWQAYHYYGLRPADGGVLRPAGERLFWAFLLVGMGAAFAGGMWLFGRLYVAAIHYDRATDRLWLRTVGLNGFNNQAFASGDVIGMTSKGNSVWITTHGIVHAPWYNLRMRGRRLPFIVDGQGRFLDDALAGRLLSGQQLAG